MNWEQILFESGDVFLPVSVKTFLETYIIGNDTSLFYINFWSIIHLISGLIVGTCLFYFKSNTSYFWSGFVIHTLWELWQIFGKNTPYWTIRGKIDIVTDTLFFLFGMWIILIIKGT